MHLLFLVISSFLARGIFAADAAPPSCLTSKCPSATPCCSPYGQCGTGAYCLGGCDPHLSFTLGSCMPMPLCKSGQHQFTSLDRIDNGTHYLGDASQFDFTSYGPIQIADGKLLMTMPPKSVGSVLTTTRYLWYGKVSATLQVAKGQGVVSAFITMSDVKDEIDFEWIGGDQARGDAVLKEAQNNYYWQQVLNYTNGASSPIEGQDAASSMHTYEIDWQPSRIVWSVDGKAVRTLNKADTFNATSGIFMYPQTPARIGLSIWPGGGETQAPGTIAWAGGPIDHNSQQIKELGFNAMSVKSLQIDCAEPPASAGSSAGKTGYRWRATGTGFLEGDVELTADNTTLASFLATGENRLVLPVAAISSAPSPMASTYFSSVATNNAMLPISPNVGVPAVMNPGGSGADAQRGETGVEAEETDTSGDTVRASDGTGGFNQGMASLPSSSGGTRLATLWNAFLPPLCSLLAMALMSKVL